MKKVLLTGSTCSGKTTFLNQLKDYKLQDQDTVILTCPESAFMVIEKLRKMGFDKDNPVEDFFDKCGNDSLYFFQKEIMKQAIRNEQFVEDIAWKMEENGKDVIIIYDRSVLDGYAFAPKKMIDSLVEEVLVDTNTFDDISSAKNHYLQKFDAYIHLESIATKPEYYQWVGGSKKDGTWNDFRKESPQQAIKIDKKIQNIYNKPDVNYIYIDNSTDFDTKISRINENIFDNSLEIMR